MDSQDTFRLPYLPISSRLKRKDRCGVSHLSTQILQSTETDWNTREIPVPHYQISRTTLSWSKLPDWNLLMPATDRNRSNGSSSETQAGISKDPESSPCCLDKRTSSAYHQKNCGTLAGHPSMPLQSRRSRQKPIQQHPGNK